MSNPFVSEERFAVVVKYVDKTLKSGLTTILVIDKQEDEERYKGNINKIHTQWVQPNWKESNELSKQCTRWEPMAGERTFDWSTYRMALLEKYMKSWDISTKGPEGSTQPIPCTPDNIGKLDPNIASALIDGFMGKTMPTDKDLGN